MGKKKKVHLVSLGCPKNLVDSEVMLGHFQKAGYAITSDAADADVIVVNTCGFIDAAKQESIDTLLELAEHKASGRCKVLVAAGCLSQRYAGELAEAMPEIDAFIGTAQQEKLPELLQTRSPRQRLLTIVPGSCGSPKEIQRSRNVVRLAASGPRSASPGDRGPSDLRSRAPTHDFVLTLPDPDTHLTADSPRVASQPFFTRYVKIAEGCSNTCAFCIIPALRGPQRSRTIADLRREVERHIDGGVVEINLIAQDLCAYGRDLKPARSLADLLAALDRTARQAKRPIWIRCLYAYPRGLTRRVIDTIANSKTIVPYLDLPLQHIADRVLRRMRRGAGGNSIRKLIARLRRDIPNVTLRTTMLVGFPGETDADFAELRAFTSETRFDHLGVFAYSPEEGTPAAAMPDQVPAEVTAQRRDELMALQQSIARQMNAAKVGQVLDVLVEGPADETELLLKGRHMGQAPEIDGLTYITAGAAAIGEVVQVQISETADYDLAGAIRGALPPTDNPQTTQRARPRHR
jgi:ribosomal protein S12 methylthiotransferase